LGARRNKEKSTGKLEGKSPKSKDTAMKKNIHPKVRQVVFKDTSSGFSFLGTSTMDSKETIKWEDGKSYPLIKLEISSASHPFFTGKQRVHDAEGRIARFKKKYGKK
jgi:large subunit ribosomal protein L31